MIRPLVPADHDRWMLLWRRYQADRAMALADDVSQVTWGRLLDPAEPMRGALALADGEALGVVHWVRHRSCWTVGDDCYLQDLFVMPAARGRGVGRGLVAHVHRAARDSGCCRVYRLTQRSDDAAMARYGAAAVRTDVVAHRTLS